MTISSVSWAVMDLTNRFPLSQKYIDFCNSFNNVDADFLEGTTAAGKTTVGVGVKFMRAVSRSSKKFHIIAAKTVGVAEKNIINQDNGILVPIGNRHAMAEAIILLLNNDELSKRLGINAIKKSKIFSSELVLQKWLEYIES